MTSSCSTWATSTSPMPSGSQNFSSSANGSMVYDLVLLADDGRLRALLDRGPDAEAEADALGAGDLEVAAVTDADLLDLVEEVVGRVAREVVGHAGLDAEAGERVLADLLELGAERVLLVAELDVRSGRCWPVGVRLGQRHGGVEVVHPP